MKKIRRILRSILGGPWFLLAHAFFLITDPWNWLIISLFLAYLDGKYFPYFHLFPSAAGPLSGLLTFVFLWVIYFIACVFIVTMGTILSVSRIGMDEKRFESQN